MITVNLIIGIVSFLLTLTAIVLGFWSYSISLRSSIRLKYYNNHSSDREQIVKREFNQRLSNAILLFLIFAILMGSLAYLVVLLIKNNVPII